MKPIAISVETAADLAPALLKEFDIAVLPFTIVLGSEEKKDGEVHSQDLFDFVAKTGVLPRTAAVNVGEFDAHFKKLLSEYESIVHISLSSGISCAYQNAKIAAEAFDGKVSVIDSRSLSTGIATLAVYATKLRDAGYDAKEIVDLVSKRIPSLQTSFALENVEYLFKGGRCSALARLGVNLLKIKPEIVLDPALGTMKNTKKFRGPREKWVLDYVEDALKDYPNPDLDLVFITASSMDPEIVEKVRARLKERGFKRIEYTNAGATISTHCGPNCLGILYINDGPHPIERK